MQHEMPCLSTRMKALQGVKTFIKPASALGGNAQMNTKGKKVTKAESVADIICVFDPEALYLRHGWSVSLIDHKRMSSFIIYALWLGIFGIWERSTSNRGPGCNWVDSFQLPVLCAPVIWHHACKL